MPFTSNQAKKDAKMAQKCESSCGVCGDTTKVKGSYTSGSSKSNGVKGQKENAVPIQNASTASKSNGGKGAKDKVAPVVEVPSSRASKSRAEKMVQKDATTRTKGIKGAAMSKGGKV